MLNRNHNIILLTVDCLRYDRCGFNGHDENTTPFLDELVSNGYVFDQAIAPGTWTSESFPGILAGRHSRDVAYYDQLRFKAIPEGAETVATQMKAAGFETVATITNTQLISHRNFDRGFDSFSNLDAIEVAHERTNDNERSGRLINRLKNAAKERIGGNKVIFELNRRDSLLTWYSIPALANQLSGFRAGWPYTRVDTVLSQFLDDLSNTTSTPVFGWTHLMDLHAPLHLESIEAGGLCDHSKYRCVIGDLNRIANNDAPVYDQMYDSVLRYVDEQIRGFVDTLKENGWWSNTTLIVTSDHGEAMGERGEYGHWSHYPYDELIRVPLIVYPAGGTDETRLEHVFSLSWLYELLAELTDCDVVDVPAKSDIGTHLDGGPKDTVSITDSLRNWGQMVVVRSDDWKLVRNYNPTRPQNQAERYEMLKHVPTTGHDDILDRMKGLNASYRISTDPEEAFPLEIAAAPSPLQLIADDVVVSPETIPEVSDTMPDEIRAKLKDLGYLDSSR